MKATDLIGKVAIRTGPMFYSNGQPDYSYCSDASEILNATGNHIVLHSKYGGTENILDNRWCDDKWIAYDDIVTEDVKTRLGVLNQLDGE